MFIILVYFINKPARVLVPIEMKSVQVHLSSKMCNNNWLSNVYSNWTVFIEVQHCQLILITYPFLPCHYMYFTHFYYPPPYPTPYTYPDTEAERDRECEDDDDHGPHHEQDPTTWSTPLLLLV